MLYRGTDCSLYNISEDFGLFLDDLSGYYIIIIGLGIWLLILDGSKKEGDVWSFST